MSMQVNAGTLAARISKCIRCKHMGGGVPSVFSFLLHGNTLLRHEQDWGGVLG